MAEWQAHFSMSECASQFFFSLPSGFVKWLKAKYCFRSNLTKDQQEGNTRQHSRKLEVKAALLKACSASLVNRRCGTSLHDKESYTMPAFLMEMTWKFQIF